MSQTPIRPTHPTDVSQECVGKVSGPTRSPVQRPERMPELGLYTGREGKRLDGRKVRGTARLLSEEDGSLRKRLKNPCA